MSKDKPNRRKEIQHQPVNFAPTNTLTGANNSFFTKKPTEPKDTTSVIEYRILFIKRFDNVTSTDVKLQKKYALNLISEALDVKETYLSLKQKGKKVESILHTDRVYYVHRGKKLIGKCSIREQRTFRGKHLIFIFKTRHRVKAERKDK